MSIIKKVRKQDAVYWPPLGVDRNGKPTYGTPIQIKCRWDDRNELMTGPDGEQFVTKSQVMVDRVLKIKGRLMLGELPDPVPVDYNPLQDGSGEIRILQNIPNMRATEHLRIAIL